MALAYIAAVMRFGFQGFASSSDVPMKSNLVVGVALDDGDGVVVFTDLHPCDVDIE